MNKGQLLRTKEGADKNNPGAWFLEDKPGGNHLAAVPGLFVVGTYERSERKLFTDYYYVKLATPMSIGGKTIAYAYIRADKVYAYSPTLQNVYVSAKASTLNIRATPFLTGKVLTTKPKGALVGQTDGTKRNGFYQVILGPSQIGWVSANYVAIRALTAKTSNPGTSTLPGETPIPDASPADLPMDGTNTTAESLDTTLDNTVGDNVAGYLKWGLAGLGVVIVFVIGFRLMQHATKPKKRHK